MADSIKSFYNNANKDLPEPAYMDAYPNAIRLLKDSNELLINRRIREVARHIVENDFNESDFYVEPSYYGYGRSDYSSIRNMTYGEAYEAVKDIQDADMYYFEDFGGFEFFLEQDKIQFIYDLKDHITYIAKKCGKSLTLLTDPSKLPEEEVVWGNEKIMSPADWDILEELDRDGLYSVDEHQGMWNETFGYSTAYLINMLADLDNSYYTFHGEDEDDEDSILSYMEQIHDTEPLLAMIIADKVNKLIMNTSMSLERRLNRAYNLTKKTYYKI